MKSQKYQHLVDLVVFALLGVIMFISKYITDALPNIHFIGMLTMTYTITYRKKALVPIYVFVLLIGLFNGFGLWWIPYLYIWAILWAITMLLPKKMNTKIAVPVYAIIYRKSCIKNTPECLAFEILRCIFYGVRCRSAYSRTKINQQARLSFLKTAFYQKDKQEFQNRAVFLLQARIWL